MKKNFEKPTLAYELVDETDVIATSEFDWEQPLGGFDVSQEYNDSNCTVTYVMSKSSILYTCRHHWKTDGFM